MTTKNTLVALDLGFGYTDALTADRAVRFPSVIAPAVDIKYTANLVGKDSTPTGIRLTAPDGRDCFVGELALRQSADGWGVRDRSRNISEDSLILAHAAFSELDLTGPVTLITGLPVKHYADKAQLIDLLKGPHAIFRAGQPPRHIEVADVIVALQPFGPLFDIIFNHEGKVQAPAVAKGRNAVIDIGTFTTDWVVCDNGEYIEHLSDSTENAMGTIYEKLIIAIAAEHDRELKNIHEADQALRQGYVKKHGQKISIAALAEPIILNTAKTILSKILNQWKDSDEELDNIYIAGGGANTIAPYFLDRFPTYAIPPESHKSVINGYYKYGLFKNPSLRTAPTPTKAPPKPRRKTSKAKANGATA